MLVELTLTNTMEYEQDLPVMQLWSEDFNGANDMLDNGGGGDSGNYLLQELYGTPSDRGSSKQHPRRMVRPPTGRRRAPSPAPSSSTRRRSAIRRPTRTSTRLASASLWPTTTRPPSIASGWADPAPPSSSRASAAFDSPADCQAPEHAKRAQGRPAQQGRPKDPSAALAWRFPAVAAWDPSTPRLAAAALRMAT